MDRTGAVTKEIMAVRGHFVINLFEWEAGFNHIDVLLTGLTMYDIMTIMIIAIYLSFSDTTNSTNLKRRERENNKRMVNYSSPIGVRILIPWSLQLI